MDCNFKYPMILSGMTLFNLNDFADYVGDKLGESEKAVVHGMISDMVNYREMVDILYGKLEEVSSGLYEMAVDGMSEKRCEELESVADRALGSADFIREDILFDMR